jgi:hypothetical protein
MIYAICTFRVWYAIKNRPREHLEVSLRDAADENRRLKRLVEMKDAQIELLMQERLDFSEPARLRAG